MGKSNSLMKTLAQVPDEMWLALAIVIVLKAMLEGNPMLILKSVVDDAFSALVLTLIAIILVNVIRVKRSGEIILPID